MTELKERRHRAVADLIREHALASQEEVAARLAALGFEVTQATVSRDLEQLGALKVRRDGRISYALPDQLVANSASPSRLTAVIRDWVRSIDVAATIVVLKTPPGSAHLVGVARERILRLVRPELDPADVCLDALVGRCHFLLLCGIACSV